MTYDAVVRKEKPLPSGIESALISGGVSIVVSSIGVVSILLTARAELKRLERTIRSSRLDHLYALRLKHYPVAFDITKPIQRLPSPAHLPSSDELFAIERSLSAWRSGEVYLILSAESLKAYRQLREKLRKGPATQAGYSVEQADELLNARSAFRRALRRDIGLLHLADYKERDH